MPERRPAPSASYGHEHSPAIRPEAHGCTECRKIVCSDRSRLVFRVRPMTMQNGSCKVPCRWRLRCVPARHRCDEPNVLHHSKACQQPSCPTRNRGAHSSGARLESGDWTTARTGGCTASPRQGRSNHRTGLRASVRASGTSAICHIDLSPFEPVDRELFSVLSDLRSLCVAVWCWAKYEMPDKREAAEYHLGLLERALRLSHIGKGRGSTVASACIAPEQHALNQSL